jgi:hypothetical protein
MRRARLYYANRTFILVLIPMFLIISSSVYPAIISTIQNKEMSIVAEAVAQLKEDNQMKRSTYTSSYPERLTVSGSYTPFSPTPVDPSFSATPSTFTESNTTPKIEDQNQEDKVTQAAIDEGDLVHVLWVDNTPGFSDIFYKRDGADFDPTTINLSNNDGVSSDPATAVSGNNVHVVWVDNTPGNFDIFYRRSTDGGATFGPPLNVRINTGASYDPDIY